MVYSEGILHALSDCGIIPQGTKLAYDQQSMIEQMGAGNLVGSVTGAAIIIGSLLAQKAGRPLRVPANFNQEPLVNRLANAAGAGGALGTTLGGLYHYFNQ